jgi:hypothetical protein
MWLIDALYAIGSLLKCNGRHDFQPRVMLIPDKAGLIHTEFFGGGTGRMETCLRCTQCTLRGDGKGFDQ